MIEPTSQTIAALAASISGVTLALLGVDYYSLLYGMLGALFAAFEAERLGAWRAVVLVILSTLIGAAFGNGLLAFLGATNKASIFVGCIVCGYGPQKILSALLRRGLDKIGGDSAPATTAATTDEGVSKP